MSIIWLINIAALMPANVYPSSRVKIFQHRYWVFSCQKSQMENFINLPAVIFPPVYIAILLMIALGVSHTVSAKQSETNYQLRVDRWQMPEESYQTIGSGTLEWTKNTSHDNQYWSVETRLNADLKIAGCTRQQNDCRLNYTSFRSLPELIDSIGCDLHIHEDNRQTSSGEALTKMTLYWNNRQCYTSHHAKRISNTFEIKSNLRFSNNGVQNTPFNVWLPQNAHLDGFPVKMSHFDFGCHQSRPRVVWVPILQLFNTQGLMPVTAYLQPDKITVHFAFHPTVFEYYFEDREGWRHPLSWGIHTYNSSLFFVIGDSENKKSEDALSQMLDTALQFDSAVNYDDDITPHASLSPTPSEDPETPKVSQYGNEFNFPGSVSTTAIQFVCKLSIQVLLRYITSTHKDHTRKLNYIFFSAKILSVLF